MVVRQRVERGVAYKFVDWLNRCVPFVLFLAYVAMRSMARAECPPVMASCSRCSPIGMFAYWLWQR